MWFHRTFDNPSWQYVPHHTKPENEELITKTEFADNYIKFVYFGKDENGPYLHLIVEDWMEAEDVPFIEHEYYYFNELEENQMYALREHYGPMAGGYYLIDNDGDSTWVSSNSILDVEVIFI